MIQRNWIGYAVTALIAALLSFAIFSFIDTNASDNTEKETDTQTNIDGDADVTNKVDNNINGDEADIENSITNDIKNGSNNKINNNITNNINVNVDVKVNNNVNNHTDGGNNGSNNEEENNEGQQPEEDGDETAWGVDSASLTTGELLACVRENFGEPQVWGRYLGEKEGVSAGITAEEVQLLQNEAIKILVIWNHFTDATGFENGQNQAREAIQLAEELGIPDGVAIIADIEPNYPVDAAFIEGYFQEMNSSQYHPGVYGVFSDDSDLLLAYNSAAQNSPELLEQLIVWTAYPQEGISAEQHAPAFNPAAPDGSLVYGWQYGLDAEACNIDTNLFKVEIFDYLWG